MLILIGANDISYFWEENLIFPPVSQVISGKVCWFAAYPNQNSLIHQSIPAIHTSVVVDSCSHSLSR